VASRVSDLLAKVAARAPFDKAAVDDPVGLMLGDPAAPVRRLALCHEVTEAVVAAVENEPVDLLVTYHPLLFLPTRQLVAGPTPEGRALRLARAGAALAVVHTNFDVAPGGCADALAEALDLEEIEPFGEGAPIGRIGRVPDGESLLELSVRAVAVLAGPPVRLAGDPDAPIARLAVVPGSGGAFLEAAREAGADGFLSGDLSHHRVRAALDAGLSVLDVGHAASERPGLARLFSFLATLGPEARSLLDLDADPWRAAS
jgi:dinuclear metal center YbgI/SA1388 family protein